MSSTKDEESSSAQTSARQKQAKKLNDAYASLEKMRRLNLEVQCQEQGIVLTDEDDYNRCTTCLLVDSNETPAADDESSTFGLSSIWNTLATTMGARTTTAKKPAGTPCLVCATPCCTKHCSPSFRQQQGNLVVCLNCEQVFKLDYVLENFFSHTTRTAEEHVLELYDRTLLLLRYSVTYIPDVIEQLSREEKRQNYTTFGTGSVGVASSLVGVATIMTPIGPPLLVGALVFGTGATAVQVGSDHRYFSLPAVQLANRILALRGFLQAILKIRMTLCAAAKAAQEEESAIVTSTSTTSSNKHSSSAVSFSKQKTEEQDTFVSRTAARIAKTGVLKLAANTTLSGAFLVWDTKRLNDTITAIRKGSPNQKAKQLSRLLEQLERIPTTNELEEELHLYTTILAKQKPPLSRDRVMEIILLVEKEEYASMQLEEEEDEDEQGESK